MDARQIPDAVDPAEEEISDHFKCCICLDILHKPIVLSCGHISCFWCVHKCMNSVGESHCPICRNPFGYFPNICELLHFLLIKLYPLASKTRESQILEYEKDIGHSSPKLDVQTYTSQANQDYNSLGDSIETVSGSPVQNNCTAISKLTDGGIVSDQEKNSLISQPTGIPKQISVADLLCAACKQLLYRPAVLNCGHVYCESCIVKPDEQMLGCQVCQSIHPSGFPKVCLDLSNFLDQQFPEEYALRKDAVQLNPCEKKTKEGEKAATLPFHPGVGCDYCGMNPIIGDRYRCKDCFEKIGFDLCGDCYNTSSKRPGRFNQQHTPEHQFELMKSKLNLGHMKLWSGMIVHGSGFYVMSPTSDMSPASDTEDEISNEEDAGYISTAEVISTGSRDEDEQNGSEPSFLIGRETGARAVDLSSRASSRSPSPASKRRKGTVVVIPSKSLHILKAKPQKCQR